MSQSGQIGEIIEIQNLAIALPKVPKEVFNRAVAFIRNEFGGMPKEEAEGMVRSILYDAVNEGGVFEGAMSGKITG